MTDITAHRTTNPDYPEEDIFEAGEEFSQAAISLIEARDDDNELANLEYILLDDDDLEEEYGDFVAVAYSDEFDPTGRDDEAYTVIISERRGFEDFDADDEEITKDPTDEE